MRPPGSTRPGDVVTRDEFRQQLWPDGTFVDFDHSLNAAVKRLRTALGNHADRPRFVETVPRRGYRSSMMFQDTMRRSREVGEALGVGYLLPAGMQPPMGLLEAALPLERAAEPHLVSLRGDSR